MKIPAIIRSRAFLYTFASLIAIELLSFSAWVYPELGNIAVILLFLGTVFVSLKDLRIGVAIILVDLIVSSHGYLLSFQHGDVSVSLRMILFLAVFLAGLYDCFRTRSVRILQSRYLYPLSALALFLLIGFGVGVQQRGFGAAFSDFNGYLFFLLVIPLFQAIQERNDLTLLIRMGIAACLASVTKLLFILYTFSHEFFWMMPETYRWIRDTRVGEVTEMMGSFWRIFFASQLFIAIAFVIVFLFLLARQKEIGMKRILKDKIWWGTFLFSVLLFTSTLVSLSRSNWVGLIAAAGALLFAYFVLYKDSLSHLLHTIFLVLCITLSSFFLIIGTVLFPLPLPGDGFSARTIFGSRISSFAGGEAAVDSRFGLLPPMVEAIREQPLLGHGFGKELTYITKDPRILAESPTGEYTTSAFEWGYLEIIIKTGALGLFAYLIYIAFLFYDSLIYLWQRRKQVLASGDLLVLGLFLGGLVLVATHAFSPYLNHPLGIGYLIYWTVALAVLMNASNYTKKATISLQEESLTIDQIT